MAQQTINANSQPLGLPNTGTGTDQGDTWQQIVTKINAMFAEMYAGFTPVTYNYISTLVTQTFYVAPRAMRVTGIIGRVRVAGSGGACTLALFKAPSGTAVGSGTALHTGSYNLVGTADANQTLTLSTTASDLLLAAGDSIGYVLTGTATSAVGSLTVTVAPV